MLKPDSEDGKSTKGTSSSSWVNCLVMTLLVISLTMAVAALWIPWERLNKLDRMTRENKHNFEQLQRLILQINGTSTSDSLSVKAELLKSVSPWVVKKTVSHIELHVDGISSLLFDISMHVCL